MDTLERYISEMTSPEDELLKELDRETNLRVVQARMISGHVQGRFLEMITKLTKPRNILEIGTFTGYSTLCFAAGLSDDACIDTIEVDDELECLSSSFFARSQHGHKIRQHTGSALEIAPKLGEVYDMVFVDGDKREYPDYYRMLMGDDGGAPLVKSGSLILADNIIWYGKIVQEIARNDKHTQKIDEFNRIVRNDDRVEVVIVDIRDGISFIRVK